MEIVTYPHPVLRHKSRPIMRVDRDLRVLVDEMFRLMYEFNGVGLAANQVAVPIRLFVANETGRKGEGEELVFINPVITRPRSNDDSEEGCLSLPGVHGNVVRPKTVRLNAYTLDGKEFDRDVSGFLARIVQHETDHLDGVLFIDRMVEGARKSIDRDLFAFETDYQSRQRTGSLEADEVLLEKSMTWDAKYC